MPRTISRLPPGRTEARSRETLWNRVVAPSAASFAPESVLRASSVYRQCLAKVDAGSFYSLRHCLEIGHDALMIELNVTCWQAGPES